MNRQSLRGNQNVRTSRTALWLTPGLMLPLFFSVAFAGSALTPQNAPRNSAQVAEELKDVGIKENLGGVLPLTLKFTDERGQAVTLGSYFQSHRPVLLTLAYYECPMLCTLVLNGVSEAVKSLSLNAGVDFQMLTVSINPKEKADLALKKKAAYLHSLA